MERTRKDPRIGITHIGFFAVIVHFCRHSGNGNPCFRAHRDTLMAVAKISSASTLYKYLNELADYGYISYKPSRNPAKRTLIGITTKQDNDNLKIDT